MWNSICLFVLLLIICIIITVVCILVCKRRNHFGDSVDKSLNITGSSVDKSLNITGGDDEKSKAEIVDERIHMIINLLRNGSHKEIKNRLIDEIAFSGACIEEAGSGAFGTVHIDRVGETFPAITDGKVVNYPAIVKKARPSTKPDVGLKFFTDPENILYIAGYGIITTEALILMFVREIESPNLPKLLTFGTCNEKDTIDTIVTVRHGLKHKFTMEVDGYDHRPLFGAKDILKEFSSYMATLRDLFNYIYYKGDRNDKVSLAPFTGNDEKIDIVKLCDYVAISIAATKHQLVNNNIYIDDMHYKNIFIHWLTKDSPYYGVKEIVYLVGDKYYKIKTHGFIIILGDLGVGRVKVRDDVMIIGSIGNIEKNYEILTQDMTSKNVVWDLLYFSQLLSPRVYEKTVFSEIMKTEPYYSRNLGLNFRVSVSFEELAARKTAIELLKFYEKYEVENYRGDGILVRT